MKVEARRWWARAAMLLAMACGDPGTAVAPDDTTSSGPGTSLGTTGIESSSSGAGDPSTGGLIEPATSSGEWATTDTGVGTSGTGVGTSGTGASESGTTAQLETESTGDVPIVVDPEFVEVSAIAGITHVHGVFHSPPDCLIDNIGFTGPGSFCTPEREVAAAAVADYDLDGWDDLLVTRTHGRPLLYRNQGNGTFVDVAVASGITVPWPTSGAAWGDFDKDGDPDLFLGTLAATRYWYYINDGAGHFTEAAVARGVAVESSSQHTATSVAVGDYDLDGFLDIYVAEWRTTLGMGDVPSHARLLRNRGAAEPGWFNDVTEAAGVSLDGVAALVDTAPGVYGFAPGFADLDGDRFPDLVVVSDFECSRLFWNDGNGTFIDGTVGSNVGHDDNGMGSTFGDFDLDGDLDWFVTAITRPGQPPGNKLYRYDGLRKFQEVAGAQGVAAGGWGWGTVFFDPDNDGDLELMMTNGWRTTDHLAERHHLWLNDDGVLGAEIAEDAGIADVSQGRGLAVLDFDRDGDQDVYVANNLEVPFLYRNETGSLHDHLRVRTIGTTSNLEGIGARVTVHVTPSSPALVREVGSASHFMGQSDRVPHFGLGAGNDPVSEVRVYWPATNQTQVFTDVLRNSELVVVEP